MTQILPQRFIIGIIFVINLGCKYQNFSTEEKVFNYYLAKEHGINRIENVTFLVVPQMHCRSCANTLVPILDTIGFCPLSYISSKEFPFVNCMDANHLIDNGKLKTYNLPLENIALISYRSGKMVYFHSMVNFEIENIINQLDSLKKL